MGNGDAGEDAEGLEGNVERDSRLLELQFLNGGVDEAAFGEAEEYVGHDSVAANGSPADDEEDAREERAGHGVQDDKEGSSHRSD